MGVTSPTIHLRLPRYLLTSFATGGSPDAEIAVQLNWRKYQRANGGALEET
jgi:hypothetical protein